MPLKRDYYEVLGCGRGASDQELKASYRRLARQYHPDTDAGDDEKFKEVAEAYGILSNPKKRSMYDAYGHEGLSRFDEAEVDLGVVLGQVFGFDPVRKPAWGYVICPTCVGRGQQTVSRGYLTVKTACPECGGSGQVLRVPSREKESETCFR